MGLMSDNWIRSMSVLTQMICPFVLTQIGNGKISYGLSSYGYDIRVANEFKVFTPGLGEANIIDPKHFDTGAMVDHEGDICVIPPNSFILARSVEYIKVPSDVLCICLGKSTYARCGIIVNTTPLEPGWEGFVTLEISNTAPLPAKIYANEGIAQIIFIRADERCEVTYADRAGKYQCQQAIMLPTV